MIFKPFMKIQNIYEDINIMMIYIILFKQKKDKKELYYVHTNTKYNQMKQ